MQQFPGDPAGLKSYGTKYERLAEVILDVAQTLGSIAGDSHHGGKAVARLGEKARHTSGEIKKVQRRYHETALAVVEFAVRLEDAQEKAAAAINSEASGEQQVAHLHHQHRDLEEQRLAAMVSGGDPQTIAKLDTDLRHLDTQISHVQSDLAHARATYDAAAHDRQVAINAAIARIVPVLNELNDTAGDYVRAAFDAIADFVNAVNKWLADVFAAVVTAILLIAAAVVALIVIALIVLVVIALLLVVLSLLEYLVISLLVAAIVVIIGAIVFLVVRSLIRETLTPTPVMTRRPDTVQGLYGRSTVSKVPGSRDEGDYENIFNNNNVIDNLGKSTETDIEIVTVRDDAGNIVGYRVVLPSTQDWEEANGLIDGKWAPTGDQGAVNDLGSNVALLTMPLGMRGPYERAVIEALEAQMRHDHTDGDHIPVMMTGFSQGGILAARMAADPHSPFNITAVVTAGSCIDTFPIPPNVSVLAIQHPDDPVPMLDGNVVGHNNIYAPLHNQNSNQVTITAQEDPGTAPHGATSYAATASHVLDTPINPQVAAIVQSQSMFFSDNEHVDIYAGHE